MGETNRCQAVSGSATRVVWICAKLVECKLVNEFMIDPWARCTQFGVAGEGRLPAQKKPGPKPGPAIPTQDLRCPAPLGWRHCDLLGLGFDGRSLGQADGQHAVLESGHGFVDVGVGRQGQGALNLTVAAFG